MGLENIKRGLMAEIKKCESEQYATFQRNVWQMCKNVLAKLKEQESVIAKLKSEIERLEILCANYRHDCDNLAISNEQAKRAARTLLMKMNHNKYKRCLAMAEWCDAEAFKCALKHGYGYITKDERYYNRWWKKWLELAKKFKEAK